MKMQTKKKQEELGQYTAVLTSRLVIVQMNTFHVDPYKSGKGRQCKKMPFRARNLSNV